MILNKYLNYLQEINYIISGDNKYFNFDKWGKESNVLYVVGFMGSGKTTIGKQLAEKYNCERISLDEIDREYRKEAAKKLGKEIWWNVFDDELNGEVQKKLDSHFKTFDKKKEKCIVEGVQILYQDHSFFKGKPVIIISTSAMTSVIRAYNRQVKKLIDDKDKFNRTRYEIIRDIIKSQSAFLPRLKKFEEYMER